MSEIWFTSDHHFGHTNVLGFEPIARPFKTVEEMNVTMIDRWNSVVKQADTIYHLGDVVFGRKNLQLLRMLNGKKRLIMGNHDNYGLYEYAKYFERIYGAKYWERCVLTHIPVHPSNLASRAMLNVHGHLHSSNVKITNFNPYVDVKHSSLLGNDLNYFNVSVEQNNLYPFNADIIRDRMKDLMT
jgi:calcineurin-like phosphoesterase family protein